MGDKNNVIMGSITITIFTELFFDEGYKLTNENEFIKRCNENWIRDFVGITNFSGDVPLFFSDIEDLVSKIYHDLKGDLNLKYKYCFWWYEFTFNATDDGIDTDDYVISCDNMPVDYVYNYSNLSYIIDISPDGLFRFENGWFDIIGDKAIGKSIIRHLAIKNKKKQSIELPYDDLEDVPF